MQINQIAGLAYNRLVGRIVRRAVLVAAIALCALVAIYQFTVAGSLVVQAHYGNVEAHLFVGAVYTFLGLVCAAAIWAMRNRSARAATPATLAGQREMQLIMLVEAVMLGYTLARKAHRTS
jgi:fucose 4-O-acetylase-like acetyltransferase